MRDIITIENKQNKKFLETKTKNFDFQNFSKKEINDLILSMKKIMSSARGIGLSANQIGYSLRVFVAETPQIQGANKFYAIFNPNIEKTYGKKLFLEEGCLSVPATYGEVERFEKVILSALDKNGRPIKIKAWGLLAHIFQHEVDHLNGVLFTSKAKNLHKTPKLERLQNRINNNE